MTTIYIYKNTNEGTFNPSYNGKEVFRCEASSLLEADEKFNTSGLTFATKRKKKGKDEEVLVPASDGVHTLMFISCEMITCDSTHS